MNLDKSDPQVKILMEGLRETWHAIAHDVCESMDGGYPEQSEIVEGCYDYLDTYGGDEAYPILRRLVEKFGYNAVNAFLIKETPPL